MIIQYTSYEIHRALCRFALDGCDDPNNQLVHFFSKVSGCVRLDELLPLLPKYHYDPHYYLYRIMRRTFARAGTLTWSKIAALYALVSILAHRVRLDYNRVVCIMWDYGIAVFLHDHEWTGFLSLHPAAFINSLTSTLLFSYVNND